MDAKQLKQEIFATLMRSVDQAFDKDNTDLHKVLNHAAGNIAQNYAERVDTCVGVQPSHRQAITTKYFGPTNARGSRVKASCDAGSVTVPWDHALNAEDNHAAAVTALCAKLGWEGRSYRGGSTAAGYVWVECGL